MMKILDESKSDTPNMYPYKQILIGIPVGT